MCKYEYGGRYEAFILNKFFFSISSILFSWIKGNRQLKFIYTTQSIWEILALSLYSIFEVRVGRLVDI